MGVVTFHHTVVGSLHSIQITSKGVDTQGYTHGHSTGSFQDSSIQPSAKIGLVQGVQTKERLIVVSLRSKHGLQSVFITSTEGEYLRVQDIRELVGPDPHLTSSYTV